MSVEVGRCQLALVAAVVLALGGCSLFDAAGGDGNDRPGGGDGGAGDTDAAPVGPCLADDFEDGVIAGEWVAYDEDGADVSEEAGTLLVSFSGGSEAWAGYDLRDRVDMTEGEVRVEIALAGGIYAGFDICFGDQELEMYVEDGENLVGEVYNTDASDSLSQIQYLAGVHVIWRIRTGDGMVYWEASQDGSDWDLIHSQAAPFPLDDVTVTVEAAGTDGDQPAAFESFAATPTGCAQ